MTPLATLASIDRDMSSSVLPSRSPLLEGIGDLKNLRELSLEGCCTLKELPASIPAHLPLPATSELRMNCHRDISSSVFA